MTLFTTEYKALVVGASGAIGQAFTRAFQKDSQCTHIEALARSSHPGFDVTDDDAIKQLAADCARRGPFNIIVDATGALHLDGIGPEKSLSALNAEHLSRALSVNAVGPVMVLRNFAPLLAPGRSFYAKLSARVGSIADNRSGGWYGYRASKAALNMLLQTAAIELQRKNPELRVVALQPGTVRSKLSAPFAANVANLLEPEQSVAGMIKALNSLPAKHGAHFIDYQGLAIAW